MSKRADVDRPEPLPRYGFCSSIVEGHLYVWGGYTDNFENRKVEIASTVCRFDLNTEQWSSLQSSGSPPPELVRGACASDDHHLYVYGGGHYGETYSGSLHRLHVGTSTWIQLSPHSLKGPRKKAACGMVAHKDRLIVFGGYCDDTSATTQPEASYVDGYTNELHTFDLTEMKWSSPTVTGTWPPPCSSFSLTGVDDHRAVLFGGHLSVYRWSNEVYFLDLEKLHWSKLDHPKGQPWPVARNDHAAAILNCGQDHQQLLVTGGYGGGVDTVSDVWMLDLQSGRWKEISLPEKYRKKRESHCTAAFSLTPALTEVVMFGGCHADRHLSATIVLRFEHSGVDWILKDCCDYSSDLGSMERVEMKRQYGYLAAYQRILAVKSSLGMLFLKMILVGPPGLGKTTFRRRLVGKIVDISSAKECEQCSTGAVESSQVIIRDISSTTIAVGPGNWSTVDDLSEEAHMFLTFFLEADEELLESSRPASPSAEVPVFLSQDTTKMADISEAPDSPESSTSRPSTFKEAETKMKPETTAPVSRVGTSKEKVFNRPGYAAQIYNMFMTALTSGNWKKIGYSLQSTVIIKMEDTGGQPELMDMLPALCLGPSLYILFCNLLDQLKSRYTVSYRHPLGESTPPVQSSYTVEEMLFQALSAISCFRSTPDTTINSVSEASLLPEDVKTSSNSVAFIVGTHKDRVTEEQISKFDEELQRVLTTTSFYTDGLVEFASENRLLLPVDNQSGGASEVERIRKFLEERIQHHFKKIPIPVAWLILSLFLRKSGLKVVSLKKVLEIAGEVGMSVEETKVALWFLHHRAGVLMYFPNLTELQGTVICDIQVIYDSVSYMIVHTFKFGQVKKAAQDMFKETGQFHYEDIVKALSGLGEGGDHLPLKALLSLLCYLNITATIRSCSSCSESSSGECLEEVIYLMPCVLQQAREEELLQCEGSGSDCPDNVCPLMIRFECGFVPIGVFPAMITNLVSQSSTPQKKWYLKLIAKGIKKNRVQFHFGADCDLITFISRPKYYEVRIMRKLEDASTPIHEVCGAVREICEATLRNVTSCMNYTFCMKYHFSFECPLHQGEDHLCIVESSCTDIMLCLKDLKCQEPVKMQREHLLWFGKDVKKKCPVKVKDVVCGGVEASELITKDLGIDDVSDVLEEIEVLSADWRFLFLKLRLKVSTLDAIEQDHPKNVRRCLCTALEDWLKLNYDHTTHGKPSWKKLAEAVRSIDGGVYEKILKKCGATVMDPKKEEKKNEELNKTKEKEDKTTSPAGSDEEANYSWDYTPDKSPKNYPSQPCFSKRGVSYTPPGWKRKYKHSKPDEQESNQDEQDPTVAKKLKF